MIYFVDYHLDSYIALIIDKFNYSIRTIYAPIGIASKGIPINDIANLNITMDISSMEKNFKVFLNEINNIDGVDNVELIAIE